jgi:hypothetical protein
MRVRHMSRRKSLFVLGGWWVIAGEITGHRGTAGRNCLVSMHAS